MNTNTTLSKGSSIQLNERRAARAGMLLLLLLTLPAVVQAQFTYTTNNGTITITKYTGPVGAVTIPGMINGLPVTSIGYEAFYNGASVGAGILTSITIPDSVTSIGDYAFAWNYTLTSATLGNGLRTIGAGAFGQCGLTGVYFLGDAPSLVPGPSVFAYDYDLVYVYYVRGTSGWGSSFGGCPTAVWCPPPSGYIYTTTNGTITITGYTGPGGDVTMPDTICGLPVTSIGDGAFANCTNLTSVTIPDSVTSIGQYAFCGCSSLASVTIPDSVTLIDGWTFDGCSSLTSVMIPDSVTNIGLGDFVNCTSLRHITIPNSVTSIDNAAFNGCTNLAAVYFQGNAPTLLGRGWFNADPCVVYYLPGTTGWGATFGGCPTALWIPGLPQVSTLPATAVSTNSATLNGTVNPNGWPSTAWFQWGTTTSYGNLNSVTDLGSGTNALSLSAALAGLTPNVTYHFRVAATNDNGLAYGSDQSFTTLGLPQVSTLPATAVSTNSATLKGTVNPNGWPTTAWFQWGTTTSYGNLTLATDLSSATTALPLYAPLAGLTPGVTYHFRIAATNDYGLAYGSDQSFTTLAPSPQVSTLPATAVSTNSATLNGTVNPNGWPTAAWFQWGTTTSYGNLTSVTNLGSGTNALFLSAQLAGLNHGVAYHFRVAATNDNGLAYGSDQSFITTSTFAASYIIADLGDLGGGLSSAGRINESGQIAGTSYVTTEYHAFLYNNGAMSDLGALWEGTNHFSNAFGINNLGQVIGASSGNACLFSNGQIVNLSNLPGFSAHVAYDINDSGQIVGTSDSSYAYIYNDGTMRLLGTLPGAHNSEPSAINNSGQVVGTAWYYNNTWRAFLYDNGGMKDLGTLQGMSFSSAADINNRGQVVGDSGNVNAAVWSHAFLYSSGQMIDLGALPGYAYESRGTGINDVGQIVGYSERSGDYARHGFLYCAGVMTDLNSLIDPDAGWTIEEAAAINNSGWIVGSGLNPKGQRHGYVLIPTAPLITAPPLTQTAEAGSAADFWVDASSPLPLFYLWYLNATNLITCSTNCDLGLTNVDFSQAGIYTVVISNVFGTVTSAPAMLNVVAPVERRPVPGVQVTGQTGSLLNMDYAGSLDPAPNWASLGSVSLTSTSQFCFDLTLPLPPQRFYRAWQTGTPGVIASLDLHPVPAITLTGSIGGSVRVDAINQFGPIDAWFNLDTVTLTNSSQLYFDTSAWRQPTRLYRLVQIP
jgi:probable HAF family extracellular repeat protein